MPIAINFLIGTGILIMVSNIVRQILFIRSTHDVVSGGKKKDRFLLYTSLLLLIFFLNGYIFIVAFSHPDLMMSLVLCGGSIFVAIILTMMFTLLDTAKERSIDIAEILIGIIDARDNNLNGHSRHVQNITMLFYHHLPPSYRNKINPVSLEYAALMHDVGKLGVPEKILNKPAALNEEEWKVMKTHPEKGVKILAPLKNFNNVTDWILYHHERMDGNGYYHVPGNKIPLASRIIAIADTYSAITMRRSYKDPRTHEEAVQVLKEVAGTQLDADLVAIFLTIPKDDLAGCIPETVKY